jgi:hypothetical protein
VVYVLILRMISATVLTSFLVLSQNRANESWEIIKRLHSDPNDPDATLALQEFYQMAQQVAVDDAAWKGGGGYKQLWTKPSFRKRMLVGFFTEFAVQTTGSNVIYREYNTARVLAFVCLPRNILVYIVKIYQTLGLSGATPVILGALYVTVAAIANFMASLTLDKFGRIRLLSM